MKRQTIKETIAIGFLLIIIISLLVGCDRHGESTNSGYFIETAPTSKVDNLSTPQTEDTTAQALTEEVTSAIPQLDLSTVPPYSGAPYYEVNDNQPFFHKNDLTTESFISFSSLDDFGRCGVAFACIDSDCFPTEPRGEIGMIKPSGWHTVRYDDLIEDKYLYNRCHLIAYSLSGENANPKNLITGTRYLNTEGMLPFENKVHDYIENTNNHVLYRVTPVFEGNNLVANGVLMEGYSVEDNGTGICFNIFCYNVQPSIEIDYADGTSKIAAASHTETTTESESAPEITYILNTNTKKFHYPYCDSVGQMKEKNKQPFTGSREKVIEMGYSPCGRCNP